MAAPPGSDLNPYRYNNQMLQAPSLLDTGGVLQDTLTSRASDKDMVFAVSAVVSREGVVSDVSVLSNDQDRQLISPILNAISSGRLEPAQFAGGPVAVNRVWLVAHTTVRAKIS